MIELENIVKTYHMGQVEVQALDDLSFSIGKGEMVAIMGPSGSGKSTVMNIMGCLDNPTKGKYVLDGVEVSGLSDAELAEVRNRKIGFVFQQFNLLPRTSALDNVELPLVYGNVSNGRQRAMEALTKVGMGHRTHHSPNQMSGGEQQRVAIARALVNQPAIILADEPTGNLDSRTSAEIMNLLLSLNRNDGITIILVTHDPEVGALTQRIITLRDGRLNEDKSINQVPEGETV
jgi:putative ABC transport system ATP-binding protein